MPKEPTYDTHESNIKDRAILVALVSQKQNLEKTKEYLSELEFLARIILGRSDGCCFSLISCAYII